MSQKLPQLQDAISSNVARRTHQALLERIVDTYSDVDAFDAYRLWGPILEWAWNSGIRTLPVFTTNYDTVIEQAVLFADEVIQGDHFSSEYGGDAVEHSAPPGYLALRDGFDIRHREFGLWDRWNFHGYNPDEDVLTVVLFKMHGSTTWTFQDLQVEEHQTNGQTVTTWDGEVGLLPPGLGRDPLGRRTAIHYPYLSKAKPHHDIFHIPYAYFTSCLMYCKLCVSIGCSFRDEAIVASFVDAATIQSASFPQASGDKRGLESVPVRDHDNPLRVVTVAPRPDHSILQETLTANATNLPVEVIPVDARLEPEFVPRLIEIVHEHTR